MARKKEKGDAALGMIVVFGCAVLALFLINSALVYHHYNKKYNFGEATARVTDTFNFVRFGPEIAAVSLLIYIAGFSILEKLLNPPNLPIFQAMVFLILMAAGLGILVVFPCLLLTARLATTQAGMLVYRQRGYFVIPTDWNKNTFTENILKFRIVRAMYEMECLALSEIKKITREGGKIAFVHGDFGTRKISWRDKQKRDECIAALENACGRRLGSHI